MLDWTFIALCVVILLFMYLWWMNQCMMVEMKKLSKQCQTDYVDWDFFEKYMENLQKVE